MNESMNELVSVLYGGIVCVSGLGFLFVKQFVNKVTFSLTMSDFEFKPVRLSFSLKSWTGCTINCMQIAVWRVHVYVIE